MPIRRGASRRADRRGHSMESGQGGPVAYPDRSAFAARGSHHAERQAGYAANRRVDRHASHPARIDVAHCAWHRDGDPVHSGARLRACHPGEGEHRIDEASQHRLAAVLLACGPATALAPRTRCSTTRRVQARILPLDCAAVQAWACRRLPARRAERTAPVACRRNVAATAPGSAPRVPHERLALATAWAACEAQTLDRAQARARAGHPCPAWAEIS